MCSFVLLRGIFCSIILSQIYYTVLYAVFVQPGDDWVGKMMISMENWFSSELECHLGNGSRLKRRQKEVKILVTSVNVVCRGQVQLQA